jgi:hypothetical protein
MTLGIIDSTSKVRLASLINEGVQTMNDILALKEALKDTVDTISEELEIDKKVLNTAIRTAWKSTQNQNPLEDSREALDEVEQVLMAAGFKV